MPQNPNQAFIANKGTVPGPGALGVQNDLLVSALHGDKYTQAVRGNLFFAANQTPVTTTVGLATTYVGLALSNPIDSVKNLVLRRVTALFLVAPAAITALSLGIGKHSANPTHTTPVTPRNGLYGSSAAPVAKVDAAVTLGAAPVYAAHLGIAANGATGQASFNFDLEGALILPPGGFAIIATNIAGPTSGFLGSYEWEEVPVIA